MTRVSPEDISVSIELATPASNHTPYSFSAGGGGGHDDDDAMMPVMVRIASFFLSSSASTIVFIFYGFEMVVGGGCVLPITRSRSACSGAVVCVCVLFFLGFGFVSLFDVLPI